MDWAWPIAWRASFRRRALLLSRRRSWLFPGPDHPPRAPVGGDRAAHPHLDALFVTRGVLRACVPPSFEKPIILRVSGGASMVGRDLAHETVTTSIEEAVRLNAAAVGLSSSSAATTNTRRSRTSPAW